MKDTRKSLLLSVVSLVLCFTMLMGTTFAWFTDTATVSVSKIVAGNLDVELWAGNVANGAVVADSYKNVGDDGTSTIWNDIKWEPGYTSYKVITIKNVGNLAFEYAMDIIAGDGVVANAETGERLSDVIDVSVAYLGTSNDDSIKTIANVTNYSYQQLMKGEEKATLADLFAGDPDGILHGSLLSAKSTVELPGGMGYEHKGEVSFIVKLHMDENAGNEYQNLTEDFDIRLYAKQYTEEADSFDDQYDATAGYEDADGNDRVDPTVRYATVNYEVYLPTGENGAHVLDNTLSGSVQWQVGKAFDMAAPNVNNPDYAEDRSELPTVDEEGTTYTARYYYKKADATVTLNVTVDGTLLSLTPVGAKAGDSYTFDLSSVSGYETTADWYQTTDERTITVVAGNNNSLNITYTRKTADVTVSYKANGVEVSNTTLTAQPVGSVIELSTLTAPTHYAIDDTNASYTVNESDNTWVVTVTKQEAEKATATISVAYNIPDLTGVTLKLMDGQNEVARTTTSVTEDNGTASFTVEGLNEAKIYNYTIVPEHEDVTSFNIASFNASVTVTFDDETNAYKATATDVELKTGYKHYVLNEQFDTVSLSNEEHIATTANGTTFETNNWELKLNTTTVDGKSVIQTTGVKTDDNSTIRTPSFTLYQDRLYQIEINAATVSVEDALESELQWGDYYRYVIHDYMDEYADFRPALKYKHVRGENDWWYEWVSNYPSQMKNQNNIDVNATYEKDKMSSYSNTVQELYAMTNNNYQQEAQNWISVTEGQWTNACINFIPSNTINDALLELHAYDFVINSDNTAWAEYSDVIPENFRDDCDQLCYLPHYYVDYITITETVPNPQ